MSQEIAIVVIHGMGSQKANYSHSLRDEINKTLGNMTLTMSSVIR